MTDALNLPDPPISLSGFRLRPWAVTDVPAELSRWAFAAHPNLARLSLYTMPGNEPSQKVAERAGFRREGLLRRWGEVNGEQLDWVMFSLIREDLVA